MNATSKAKVEIDSIVEIWSHGDPELKSSHYAEITMIEDVLAEDRTFLGYRWAAKVDWMGGEMGIQAEMAPIGPGRKRFKERSSAFRAALEALKDAIAKVERGRRDRREFRFLLTEAAEEWLRGVKGGAVRIIPMEGSVLECAVEALATGCGDVEGATRILPAWRYETEDGLPVAWVDGQDEYGNPIPVRARIVKCSGEKRAIYKLALGWSPDLVLLVDPCAMPCGGLRLNLKSLSGAFHAGSPEDWGRLMAAAARDARMSDKGKVFIAEPTFKLHASDATGTLQQLPQQARTVVEGIIRRTAIRQADFLEALLDETSKARGDGRKAAYDKAGRKTEERLKAKLAKVVPVH